MALPTEKIRPIDVQTQIKEQRHRDQDCRRFVVAPILHEGIDDGRFEDDVRGLREEVVPADCHAERGVDHPACEADEGAIEGEERHDLGFYGSWSVVSHGLGGREERRTALRDSEDDRCPEDESDE